VFVQEAKKCFEEALERATAEAEEDEKYYKLIAITIRSEFLTVLYPLFKGTVASDGFFDHSISIVSRIVSR
jgi:hypothetical protein